MPWKGKATPINNPPATPYSLLPWGGALQVTGEEKHFDVLKPLVPSDGDGLLLVTLRKDEITLKNGTVKAIVAVLVGDDLVGELSSTTSKHFIPTIDHLSQRGMGLVAWARIQGSPIGAEVKIQGARANEIPAEWFGGEPATVPPLVPYAASYTVPPAYIPQATKPSRSSASQNISRTTSKLPAKSGAGCAGVLFALVVIGTTIGTIASNLTV
jgi:collagen type III alpha